MELDLEIKTAPIFEPLLYPSRYKGAWGGRGSGKSHFFAELLVERCLQAKTDWICGREVQKSLKDSAKKLIEAKIDALGVGKWFDIQSSLIKTPHGGQIIFTGLQDHTTESIKSFDGFDGIWIEEAQSVKARSWELIRPTIRKDGSEIWASWNPTRKNDPVEAIMRGDKIPKGAVVVRANWSDNPWFPPVLADEREDCLKNDPDQYDHIWEGGFKTIYAGAYYAAALKVARAQDRFTALASDPIMPIYAVWDIGMSDSTSIWVCQFVGREIRVLDYFEAQGQALGYYLGELRARGYGNAECVLPHDGARRDSVQAVKFEDHIREAGFRVKTIQNQGQGAAMKRVETARRLFPRIVFNSRSAGVTAGVEALSAYHEKRDEERNIGLGPEHDWSSHAADSFGLMCCAYREPDMIEDDFDDYRRNDGRSGHTGY